MKEYELEVLERYDVEVRSTRRIRGAFFCDTNEGTMLLKETKISEKRAPLLYFMLRFLETQENIKVDTPVFTRDGELLVTAREGTRYMMKKWYAGRECDIKKETDLLSAAETLAHLHKKLQWQGGMYENAERPPTRRSPLEEVMRHNREMKKVRAFIRERVAKNEFEYLYLQNFDKMYGFAELVMERMERSGCGALYEKSVQENRMVHGDYNYHNILMMPGQAAVTIFEHMRIDIQVQDLYYFIRKVMEKHHWKQKLGRAILEAYQNVRRLDPMEMEYIGLSLAYPEKFWKTASSYSRSNKAWLPEKSVEKLELAVRQTEEKTDFLENIFSLNLRRPVV